MADTYCAPLFWFRSRFLSRYRTQPVVIMSNVPYFWRPLMVFGSKFHFTCRFYLAPTIWRSTRGDTWRKRYSAASFAEEDLLMVSASMMINLKVPSHSVKHQPFIDTTNKLPSNERYWLWFIYTGRLWLRYRYQFHDILLSVGLGQCRHL